MMFIIRGTPAVERVDKRRKSHLRHRIEAQIGPMHRGWIWHPKTRLGFCGWADARKRYLGATLAEVAHNLRIYE